MADPPHRAMASTSPSRIALANGGRDDGAPGIREDYNANYYGAFVRDLDGNKIEAVTYSARESFDGRHVRLMHR
jgi:hypothetical protein